MHANPITVSLLCSLSTAAALDKRGTETFTISIPTAAPTDASAPVKPNFPAYAFEERSFYTFMGTSSIASSGARVEERARQKQKEERKREQSEESTNRKAGTPDDPNDLTLNLISAITDKTGATPNTRVGGSSLDNSQYDPNQAKAIKIPADQADKGMPSNMTFGPSYFDAFSVLTDAKYVIDIPMKKKNLTNSKLFAKAAYNKVGSANIFAFEIGNEPNNYGETMATYVTQWENWSSSISTALGLADGTSLCQAVAMGAETGATGFPGGGSWKVYQTKANPDSDLQYDLMNHTAVVKGSAFVKNAITYLNNQSPAIPLVLGEVASILGNSSNNRPLEAVLGSTLWQVDFHLYSMFIGVERINWQSGLSFPFALWNPKYDTSDDTVAASVHAAYYGHMFAADFRGDAATVRMYEIELGRPFFSAYAAYDNGKLGRIALTNLELWSSDDSDSRTHKTVTVNVGTDATSVTVKRLTAVQGGSAGVGNMTYGGQQWTAASNGKPVQVLDDTTTHTPTNGKVDVMVKASEALMLVVNY